MGRCEAKLLTYGRVRGLVVGGWGELNGDFKELVESISQSRHKLLENQAGGRTKKSDRQQLATIKYHTRQQLSRVCVQAQARLLLDRLEGLGGGGQKEGQGQAGGVGLGEGEESSGCGQEAGERHLQGWRFLSGLDVDLQYLMTISKTVC